MSVLSGGETRGAMISSKISWAFLYFSVLLFIVQESNNALANIGLSLDQDFTVPITKVTMNSRGFFKELRQYKEFEAEVKTFHDAVPAD